MHSHTQIEGGVGELDPTRINLHVTRVIKRSLVYKQSVAAGRSQPQQAHQHHLEHARTAHAPTNMINATSNVIQLTSASQSLSSARTTTHPCPASSRPRLPPMHSLGRHHAPLLRAGSLDSVSRVSDQIASVSHQTWCGVVWVGGCACGCSWVHACSGAFACVDGST